jgi:hypothetical protein
MHVVANSADANAGSVKCFESPRISAMSDPKYAKLTLFFLLCPWARLAKRTITEFTVFSQYCRTSADY